MNRKLYWEKRVKTTTRPCRLLQNNGRDTMGNYQEQKGQNNYKLETIFLKSELLHHKSYAPNSQKLYKKQLKDSSNQSTETCSSKRERGLDQIIEKLYIKFGVLHSLPMTGAKERTHLMTPALAWRMRVVFTFILPMNTNSSFQSLATATIAEKRAPTAVSTLILNDKLRRGIQVWVEEETCCLCTL